MSGNWQNSAPRAKTIFLFKEAKKRLNLDISDIDESDVHFSNISTLLQTLLGPKLSERTELVQPTDEQVRQGDDIHEFVYFWSLDSYPWYRPEIHRLPLYNLLAMHNYISYEDLVGHFTECFLQAGSRAAIKDVNWRVSHPSACPCGSTCLCTDFLLCHALINAIRLNAIFTMTQILLRDFQDRAIDNPIIDALLRSPSAQTLEVFMKHWRPTRLNDFLPEIPPDIPVGGARMLSIIKLMRKIGISVQKLFDAIFITGLSVEAFLVWEPAVMKAYGLSYHIHEAASVVRVLRDENLRQWLNFIAQRGLNRRQLLVTIMEALLDVSTEYFTYFLNILKVKHRLTFKAIGYETGIVYAIINSKVATLELIPVLIHSYDLNKKHVKLRDEHLAAAQNSEVATEVFEGKRRPGILPRSVLFLTQYLDFFFSDIARLIVTYFNPSFTSISKDDLHALGKAVKNVYVTDEVVVHIMDYGRRIYTIDDDDGDWVPDPFDIYVDNAYAFFGKRLQLHMLAERAHLSMENDFRRSFIFDEMTTLTRIFDGLDASDVEQYLRNERTSRIRLYITKENINANLVEKFVIRGE